MIAAVLLAATVSAAAAAAADVAIPQVLAHMADHQGRRVRVRGCFIADALLPNAGRLCPAGALDLSVDCLAVDLGRKVDGAAGAWLEVTGVFDGGRRRNGGCIDFRPT